MKLHSNKADIDTDEVVGVLRRIFAENGREYIGTYIFAIACLVVVALTTAFTAWIMESVVNEAFIKQRAAWVWLICGAILATFVLRGIASYLQAVALARIGNNLVARYKRRLFDHLMALGVDFFNETRSSQLAARIGQNVNGIRNVLNLTITSIARDCLTLIALVGVMIMKDPLLTLIAGITAPALILMVASLSRRLRRTRREAVEVNARVIGAMQEASQGITIVKAFTMEAQLREKLADLVSLAENRANKIARITERTSPLAEIAAGFAIAAVIGYAAYRSINDNMMPGTFLAFIAALLLAYDPVRRLARLQVDLSNALINARMIYELLDLQPQQRDEKNAGTLKVASAEIVFDRVNFAYGEAENVLKDVSFTGAAGETTALVGPSGAGKSTIIGLIQRFYDPAGGVIRIDGQDIAGVTKKSLRASIAYVSQQPYLFEGTIRENIRYGRPDASDTEIEEAATRAQAHDFISAQPLGYDTPVGENGVTLSGGQRQRLSIARALVRNAPILLLDEATSALDSQSELLVQQALESAMRGRTVIVIAHRLSTIVNADKIVVMDEGRIVEEGTHNDLSRRPNGVYANLHALQGADPATLTALKQARTTRVADHVEAEDRGKGTGR